MRFLAREAGPREGSAPGFLVTSRFFFVTIGRVFGNKTVFFFVTIGRVFGNKPRFFGNYRPGFGDFTWPVPFGSVLGIN